MIRPWLGLLVFLLNVPQVVAAVALMVYSIWFAKYEQRNVGPLVSHTAEYLLLVFVTFLVNTVLWFILRKHRAESRFLWRVVLWVSIVMLILFWLGERFLYAGSR